jgi:hypothetical protein
MNSLKVEFHFPSGVHGVSELQVILCGEQQFFLPLLVFFLENTDELEVSLVLELVEDAGSISRFGLVCDAVGDSVCFVDGQAVSPPAIVLVFRPASSKQSSLDEFADFATVVPVGLNSDSVEVIL